MPQTGFFAANPYLFSNLFGLATVALAWTFAGRQRGIMLLAGAVIVLFIPAGVPIDREYWNPVRLGGGSYPGIEDVLYTFVLGARAWFFATVAFRADCAAAASGALFLRRAALVTAPALAAFAGLIAFGAGATLAAFLVPAGVAACVLLLKRQLWRLSLFGALGSALTAYLELLLWLMLWPQLGDWWAPGTPWSVDFLGVPRGDVAWSALVGAAHPAVMGFVCDMRLRSRGVPS
jgi:hypothetical protein